MAASSKHRFKYGPLDKWSVREKLALASSVKRSGDQNWVSVSRAIKPFGEPSRPPDWFSQKNCALQYADMLEKAETPKRKRGEKGEVIDTPANQIMRKLTIERIEELKQMIQEEQQKYKKFKREVESIKAGQCDDKLTEMWEKIQTEKKEREEKQKEEERKANQEAMERAQAQALRRAQAQPQQRTGNSIGSLSEMDESTQDSFTETLNVETTDDEMPATPTPARPITIDIPLSVGQDTLKTKTPTSPLLSSLLQSKQISVDSLQQIKDEAEAAEIASQQAAADKEAALRELSTSQPGEPKVTPGRQQTDLFGFPAPSLNTLLGTTADLQTKAQPDVTIVTTLVPDVKHEVDVVTTEEVIDIDGTQVKQEDIECETVEVETVEEIAETVEVPEVKQEEIELEVKSEVEVETTTTEKENTSFINVEEEISVKDEPMSPASSVSSRISETGSSKKSKGRSLHGVKRGGSRAPKRSTATDDEKKDELSSRPSDGETTDDDGDSSVVTLGNIGMSAFSESIPSSPLSHCSDTEDDKAYKTWKKSIMLVWRAAANHKYANVFLHPVTNDIAPGYTTVVRRPKDLSTIKRHIENGTIRTTTEFQHDMMLMFTNAVMYNSSNHDVYKMAVEMYDDVMQHIEQYVSTQLMVQNTEAKLLRPSRRNESSDKEEESRRRRTSSEEGGKTKKRKSRADDT